MPSPDFQELKTDENLEDLQGILDSRRRLQGLFDELAGQAAVIHPNYMIIARWYKRLSGDNGRFCPIANIRALHYVLTGYLQGNNQSLEFYAMHQQVVKAAWARTAQSREDLFL